MLVIFLQAALIMFAIYVIYFRYWVCLLLVVPVFFADIMLKSIRRDSLRTALKLLFLFQGIVTLLVVTFQTSSLPEFSESNSLLARTKVNVGNFNRRRSLVKATTRERILLKAGNVADQDFPEPSQVRTIADASNDSSSASANRHFDELSPSTVNRANSMDNSMDDTHDTDIDSGQADKLAGYCGPETKNTALFLERSLCCGG
jgi:hypothetical protein